MYAFSFQRRGSGAVGETGEEEKEVQASSYEINELQGCKVQDREHSQKSHDTVAWRPLIVADTD